MIVFYYDKNGEFMWILMKMGWYNRGMNEKLKYNMIIKLKEVKKRIWEVDGEEWKKEILLVKSDKLKLIF